MANVWILIRHPDKDGDEEGVYLGHKARITQKGKRQVERIVDRLSHLREAPELVLSSGIARAIQLAQVIGTQMYLPSKFSELFNEIEKPEFLVDTRRDDPVHQEIMASIRRKFDRNQVPAGVKVKSRRELESETRAVFKYVEDLPEKTVLCVSHAKRIASFIHWVYCCERTLYGMYRMADRNITLNTTGVTILRRKEDRRTGQLHWHIDRINDTSHEEGFLSDELGDRLLSVK